MQCWSFALLIWHLFVWKKEVVVDPYMKRVRSENNRYLNWQKQSSSQQGVVWQHWRALRRLLTSERGAWANRCDKFSLLINWIELNLTDTLFLKLYCPFSGFLSMFLRLIFDRVQPEVKLKLSNAETYSKMRLKLVPNYNYDPHSDASAQRDNMGMSLGIKHISSALLSCKQCTVKTLLFLWSAGADSPRSSEPLPLAVAKEAKVSDMEDDQLGEEDVIFLDDKWVSNLHNFCSSDRKYCKQALHVD